jgi:hypothetical protein
VTATPNEHIHTIMALARALRLLGDGIDHNRMDWPLSGDQDERLVGMLASLDETAQDLADLAAERAAEVRGADVPPDPGKARAPAGNSGQTG